MEAQHEKELQRIQEIALIKISKDFEAEVLANLFKKIQQNEYTITIIETYHACTHNN